MGWQKSGSGSLCYVSRKTVNGRTIIKYGGTGEKGRLAELTDENDRLRERVQLLEWELEEAIIQYQHEIAEVLVENELICLGFIQRNRKWIMIDRLREPLTEEEKSTIKQAKESKATGIYHDVTEPRLYALKVATERDETREAYIASCRILKIAPSNFDPPIYSKHSSPSLS